jgi:hypothetical protein
VGSSINKANISSNIKRIGDLGLRVSLTEIDVKNGTVQSWTNLIGAAVENYNATTIMCWGFDDAHSWLGNPCNCQMWDAQSQPKTDMVNAVQNLFATGDPTVAAKRKTFMGLSPTALMQGRGKPAALDFKSTPRITLNNGTLSYVLPEKQNVHVQIVDLHGRVALDMNLGSKPAGTHSVRLADQKLGAGLYLARVKAGTWSVVSLPAIR